MNAARATRARTIFGVLVLLGCSGASGCARDISEPGGAGPTVSSGGGPASDAGGGSGGSTGGSGGSGGGAMLLGSCNPSFCPGAEGIRCCLTPNGPCGQDFGDGCTEAPSTTCQPEFCPTQFGTACCPSDTSACGIDLGAGCTERDTTDASALPPVVDGAVNLYGVCGLPPEAGTCTESAVMYAWVPALRACAPFSYSGCGGNENRFETEAGCLERCGDRPALTECSCSGESASCAPAAGCSKCPANTNLSANLGSLSCDSVGLYCDSGQQCGTFCECVADDRGGAVWACASRLC